MAKKQQAAEDYTDEELAQIAGIAPAAPGDEYSDEELQKIASGAADEGSAIEAFAQGVGQSVPVLGSYIPQLGAAAGKGMAEIYDLVKGTDVSGAMGSVSDQAKIAEAEMQKISEQSPVASVAGRVAGTLGSGFGMAGALRSAGVKAASGFLPNAIQSGVIGGVEGALTNPGEGEGLQVADRAKNAALSAGLSFLLGGAAGKLAGGAKGAAEKQAFKALGPYAREARQAFAKGKVNEIGRELLDEGVISNMPKTYGKLAETLEDAASKKGASLGKIVDQLDEFAKGNNQRAVAAKDIGERLKAKLIKDTSLPGVGSENEMHAGLIDEFVAKTGNLSLKGAEELKRKIGDLIKWDRLPGADIPPKETFYRAVYRELAETAEKGAEQVDKLASGASSTRFKDAKSAFGNLKEAANIVAKRDAKEFANRLISPSDYITGGLGAAAGFGSGEGIEDRLKRATIGASLGLGNKALRTFGPQVAAKQLDTLSKGLSSSVVNPLIGSAVSQAAAPIMVQIPLEMQTEVRSATKTSKLSNIEKAKLLQGLNKSGEVSQTDLAKVMQAEEPEMAPELQDFMNYRSK